MAVYVQFRKHIGVGNQITRRLRGLAAKVQYMYIWQYFVENILNPTI